MTIMETTEDKETLQMKGGINRSHVGRMARMMTMIIIIYFKKGKKVKNPNPNPTQHSTLGSDWGSNNFFLIQV